MWGDTACTFMPAVISYLKYLSVFVFLIWNALTNTRDSNTRDSNTITGKKHRKFKWLSLPFPLSQVNKNKGDIDNVFKMPRS